MEEKRYYYKAKSGKVLLCLKSPLSKEELKKYVEITAEQFAELEPKPHVPTAAETAKAEKERQIASLKKFLCDTDYCVIKIAEGVATSDEYASVLIERANARSTINQLESEL